MNELPQYVGRFPIIDLLGIGGMGIVYLAEDPDIGRKVAIKVLHASESKLALERFKNEARTVGELSHPNIVMLLEYGVENNRPYLVMEYLPGISLEDWIETPHTLAEHKKVLIGLCDALSYAHEKNILHRDLKLGNIQVLPNGESKLLDFGIARSQDVNLTTTGFFVGTPKYLAPEILSNSNHSKISDCYSLGLVAYTLFSNRDPYQAPTFEGIVARKLTITPLALNKINPQIPESLSKIIDNYLEKDPETRPKNPEALKSVLEQITSEKTLQRIIEYLSHQDSEENLYFADDKTQVANQSSPKRLKYTFASLIIIVFMVLFIAYSQLFEPSSSNQIAQNKPLPSSDKIKQNPPQNAEDMSLITPSEASKTPVSEQQETTNDLEKNNPAAQPITQKKLTQKPIEKTQTAKTKTNNKATDQSSSDINTKGSLPKVQVEEQASPKSDALTESSDEVKTQNPSVSQEAQSKPIQTHQILPELSLKPISRKSQRIKLEAISSTNIPRGKTTQLSFNTSQEAEISDFKFFRGRKEFTQISLLKIEQLSANKIRLHLYVDPNTKLGEYSLVGYYKNKKTSSLTLEVTL